jgi:hypothetical protein
MRTTCIITWAALASILSLYPANARGESLKLHLNGEQLHVEAHDLRFLSQTALARLHDGATVIYRFRMLVSDSRNGNAVGEYTYHCVFSFDILEEKYKVSRQEPGYRTASHLSESAARDLCLDSLTIPPSGITANAPFWVAMEYQMEDRQSDLDRSDSHSVLDTLVNIFGQRNKAPQPVDVLRGGPFRMDDLRKSK